MKSFLVVFILLATAVWSPIASFAQSDVVTYMGPVSGAGHCGNYDCCWEFQVTINSATQWINLHVNPWIPGADASCLHICCSDPDATASQGSADPSWFFLYFGSTTPEYNGTALPKTITFYICGSNACMAQFPTYSWFGSSPSNSINGSAVNQNLSLCTGYFNTNCNHSGCDKIEAVKSSCWIDVCFFSNETTQLDTIDIHISPNPFSGTGGAPCTGVCEGAGPNSDLWMEQNGWTAQKNTPNTGDVRFLANPGHSLDPCKSFCFGFPLCSDLGGGSVGISLIKPAPCPGDGTVNVALKQNTQEPGRLVVTEIPTNFPNPLTEESSFKTSIPFSTAEKGTASIRVVDQSGKTVLKEDEEVTYAGKHFFYFSAKNLPSGTYYYQIEFPKGVVIVNRTMVVVK